MSNQCAEILEQRIVDNNSTQSVYKQGNRIIVVDGICKGEKRLGELLLEIAADKINAVLQNIRFNAQPLSENDEELIKSL